MGVASFQTNPLFKIRVYSPNHHLLGPEGQSNVMPIAGIAHAVDAVQLAHRLQAQKPCLTKDAVRAVRVEKLWIHLPV